MKLSTRPFFTLALGGALAFGLAGCGNLPDIDPSNLPTSLPSISRPAAPTDTAEPAPTETTDPAPTETSDPEPVPTKTVTAEPEPVPEPEETSEPEVTSTSEATAEDDADESSTVWWPWVVLAAVVLVIAIILVRRSSVRGAWDKQLDQAKSELSWFEDSLVPQILSKPTAAEAASLWQAARPRVLDIDRQLHELAAVGLSEDRTESANQGLAALQNLTNAIEAETGTEAVADADALRARRANVDGARAQARKWFAPPTK